MFATSINLPAKLNDLLAQSKYDQCAESICLEYLNLLLTHLATCTNSLTLLDQDEKPQEVEANSSVETKMEEASTSASAKAVGDEANAEAAVEPSAPVEAVTTAPEAGHPPADPQETLEATTVEADKIQVKQRFCEQEQCHEIFYPCFS